MNIAADIALMHADWSREITLVRRTAQGYDAVTDEATGWDEVDEIVQAVVAEPKEKLEGTAWGGIERYDFELRLLPPLTLADTDYVRFDGLTFQSVGQRLASDGTAAAERVYHLREVSGA